MSRDLFGPGAWSPLARGWNAYWQGDRSAELLVHVDDGEAEAMPISIFFRGGEGLRPPDRLALELARGRVLDAGAGVGCLSLLLQEAGADVTALEVVPRGVEIMRERGVGRVVEGRLEGLAAGQAFDTILLLMNGTALAGTLSRFPLLLETLEGLLAPGGLVLMDSTDLGSGPEDAYPGELHYQMEFEGERGAPFPQLFLDPTTLERLAVQEGWTVRILWSGEEGEYLAGLERASP